MPRCEELELLSDRMVHGVRADAVPIARLRVRGVGRALLRRLADAGLTSPDALREAGPDAVKAALRHRGAFNALWARLTEDDTRTPRAVYAPAPGGSSLAAEPVTEYRPSANPQPSLLEVNLRDVEVRYRGHAIRTKPPNHLQRQPLLALAALASSPGQTVPAAELAEKMHALGALRRKPVAPDPRDLRYKMLRPFKRALGDIVPVEELNRLIESVPQVGLRLNISKNDVRVITRGRV